MKTSSSSDFSSTVFAVQFWGVRGSVPTPGEETIRYGGNTSCIEIRVGGKRLIFDGGTGIRMLAQGLTPHMPIQTHLFFTHYHWDHIQGIPFFTPFFTPNNRIHIRGNTPPESQSLEEHFMNRVMHVYSPVPTPTLQADLKFSELEPGDVIMLEDISIETGLLNHPNGAMGYRITWQGHSAVYCTDTEHYPDRLDEDVLRLARNADVLIYDAMYTDEEYHNPKAPKVGWGHSTWQEGVKVAKAAGVKKLVIFHHEPNHDDHMLDRIAVQVKDTFPHAVLAREGMILPVIKPPVPRWKLR